MVHVHHPIPVSALLLPEALRLKGAGNYKLWKFAIIALLEQNYLLDSVEVDPDRYLGQRLIPTNQAMAAEEAGARLAIFLNISEEHQILIANHKTASQVWASLVGKYESQSESIKTETH
jgi:hypothetical protein